MTLIKSHLINAVSEGTGYTKKRGAETVETLIEILKKTLESGEQIKISNFGKFCVKEKKERAWRNPFNGHIMMLPPKRVVIFKCFKKLKDKINAEPLVFDDKEPSPELVYANNNDILSIKQLKKFLDDHRTWLRSDRKKGKKTALSFTKLMRADLYAAFLPRVNLHGANLHAADMSEADLYEANLQEANLGQAVLIWANLDGANLQKASLQGADLRWANLEGANLTGADLRGANFTGANLREAKLLEADLYGANLTNTDMEDAVLSGVKLDPETESKLPSKITDKYRKTFLVTDGSPTISRSE